jgi:DNA repair protein RecO (recombination protein O)
MLLKTGGIVFRFIRYRETSVIATIFTEKLGLQSYIVNGVRSKKPKIGIALFQPLTLLEMVVYHRENASLNRISEVKCAHPFIDIPLNVRKSSIALFLAEVLFKSIKHESHPEIIYNFLHSSLLSLEHLSTHFENFHLQFLLKLTRHLGFYPESGSSFRNQLLHGETTKNDGVDHFLKEGYNNYLALSNKQRLKVLDNILEFYKLHIDGFGNIQSTYILHNVIHN